MLVKQSIPFQDVISASTSKTIRSEVFTRRFWTWKIIMHFPDAANYLLLYRWFLAQDDKTAGTGVPSGAPLFKDFSLNDSWRGKNVTLEIAHVQLVEELPAVIKLYTTNGVASQLSIACAVEILREV